MVALCSGRSPVNITLLPMSTGAAALDGSPYGFFFLGSNTSTQWTISIQGGGWCVGVGDCYDRSQMKTLHGKPGSYGSSVPLMGHPEGCGCMNPAAGGLATDCNCIMMPYLDGASFSGERDQPVPVSSHPGKFVHYKGLRNFDATLDYAFAHLGLERATEMVVTGGSAGGLSTFLHLDRVAARMERGAPACTRTTGAPVVGFFLDHANYHEGHGDTAHGGGSGSRSRSSSSPSPQPGYSYPRDGTNYSSWMERVVSDQNVSSVLLPDCLAAFPREPHLCFMSPHMVQFIASALFIFNSRFDAWQMQNDLQAPCINGDMNHPVCNATEQAAMVRYGDDFLAALQPVVDSAPKNGAFITSCICHSCSWATLKLDGASSYTHYSRWYFGGGGGGGGGEGSGGEGSGGGAGGNGKGNTSMSGLRPGLSGSGSSTIHLDRRAPNGGGQLTDPKCVRFP